MTVEATVAPRSYPGVMVSSTFTDLESHRKVLIRALLGASLTPVMMEHDSAKSEGDVIDSSLQMVRDASAYIAIISKRYGQIPHCAIRNPGGVSITELEFDEALRLKKPILLFIMGDNHLVLPSGVETNPAAREKLQRFTERAKLIRSDSKIQRVYAVFNSVAEFTEKAFQSVAELRKSHPDTHRTADASSDGAPPGPIDPDVIPKAPGLYAQPPYIGSHQFVGRQEQLEQLNRWAGPSNPHPVLLFEAIGGTGKSMLTWEWVTHQAATVRSDWAGSFWYSFYERGAIMADFCRHALAYMTDRLPRDFLKFRTPELAQMLIRHLNKRPYLFVLDGLERVLVAYHRIDYAEVPDEVANDPKDELVNRHPCAAIRTEDDDLLKALVTAAPSKILISSRLVPRVLVNQGGSAIPGVSRVTLPGLLPEDAEALLHSCGVTGTSKGIRDFLERHCDCHPLVIGILAGLINEDLPNRGNFDAWEADPLGGGRLDLGSVNLIKKRNDILRTAMDALPANSRELLSVLALIPEAVDYTTLAALNPFAAPKPEEVSEPDDPHLPVASQTLAAAVRDLEKRGLLQYDHQARRYDLHPVVRGVASGRLADREKARLGERVVDYFSQQTRDSYYDVESLGEVRAQLNIVHTLLKIQKYDQACGAYLGVICNVLDHNFEAYSEVLAIVRPFFPDGWNALPRNAHPDFALHLTQHAASALRALGHRKQARALSTAALLHCVRNGLWMPAVDCLVNIASSLSARRSATMDRINQLTLDIVLLVGDANQIFTRRLDRFMLLTSFGRFEAAQGQWALLDPMGRNWPPNRYRRGYAELLHAQYHFCKGTLTESLLMTAKEEARKGKERATIQSLNMLCGEWQLARDDFKAAAETFSETIRIAREAGGEAGHAETLLALAKVLQKVSNFDARAEAERLSGDPLTPDHTLAKLWFAIGDHERAKTHALDAYKHAWGGGTPYTNWYALQVAAGVLHQLGEAIPDLPPYDESKEPKLEWESELAAALEKFRDEAQFRKH